VNKVGVASGIHLEGGYRDLTTHRGAFAGATTTAQVNAIATGAAPAANTDRVLPAIKVHVDRGEVHVNDGRHRLKAAAEAGATEIRAIVRTYVRGRAVERETVVSIHGKGAR